MDDSQVPYKAIEFSMLHKHLFLPLSGLSSFTVHTLLYPFVLVRTRLQLQDGSSVYKGLVDATRHIVKEEGLRGLYSGYFTKSSQLISGFVYVATYEGVRDITFNVPSLTSAQRAFIGGGCASLLAQTMLVPVDVVAQHIMLLSRSRNKVEDVKNINRVHALTPIKLSDQELSSNWRRFTTVTKYVYSNHGLKGFYHGYIPSLVTYVPASGVWWSVYDYLCSTFSSLVPETYRNSIPRLAIQLTAAPLSGIVSSMVVNPMDTIRVRMQVTNRSFSEALKNLWQVEGWRFCYKGLSARTAQSSLFSFWIILFYEPVKIYSLKEEYRDEYKRKPLILND